jgi:hypothetical protein
MFKMGLYDPFGHFKHKLWPKEGPGVNLTIWLPTTKSWESPQFPCAHVACYIPLKRSQWYLQLSSYVISIRGLHTRLWAPKVGKVVGVPTLGISGLQLGSLETKWHLGVGHVVRHKVYYKGGRWWLCPNPGHGESCESVFARGLFVHQSAPTTH